MGKAGFKDLVVWKRAKDLAVFIYKISSDGGLSKDFGLRDQLRRAAVSIPSNLAEGDERGTDVSVSPCLMLRGGEWGRRRGDRVKDRC